MNHDPEKAARVSPEPGSETSVQQDQDLLAILDTWVRADAAPPGFSGRVAFGLKHYGGVRWWMADLGGKPATTFSRHMPASADVLVGLTEEEAGRLLANDRATNPNRKMAGVVSGDVQLLKRFLDRYVRYTNLLTLRTGVAL